MMPPSLRSRYWKVGATTPVAIIRWATPISSSISRVGGWKVEARRSSARSGSASTRVTGIPAAASRYASTRPTGPAPTIRTRLSVVAMPRTPPKCRPQCTPPHYDRLRWGSGGESIVEADQDHGDDGLRHRYSGAPDAPPRLGRCRGLGEERHREDRDRFRHHRLGRRGTLGRLHRDHRRSE